MSTDMWLLAMGKRGFHDRKRRERNSIDSSCNVAMNVIGSVLFGSQFVVANVRSHSLLDRNSRAMAIGSNNRKK